jgi:hypothetical protein
MRPIATIREKHKPAAPSLEAAGPMEVFRT